MTAPSRPQSLMSAFRALCVEIEALPEADAAWYRGYVIRMLDLLTRSLRAAPRPACANTTRDGDPQ